MPHLTEYLAEIAEVQVVIKQVRLLLDACYVELIGKRLDNFLAGAFSATVNKSVPPSQNRKSDYQNGDEAKQNQIQPVCLRIDMNGRIDDNQRD